MAAYTWNKQQCPKCGNKERTRGRPMRGSSCCYCRAPMQTTEIHWGPELYAGTKAGTVEKFPLVRAA